jgi:hypothetical protein
VWLKETSQKKQTDTKAAGEVSPPSRSLTGPARPRRSVCAPAAMALSFYRRPASERRITMSIFSWVRNRTSTSPRGRARQRPTRRSFQPRLEVLEGRDVPSTLKVFNLADSGVGTLRYEIAHAQSGDTIVFDFGNKKANGTPHTITLSSGELDINKSLTIQGPGAGLLAVTSTGYSPAPYGWVFSSRIFEVETNVSNVTLTGMTISNGDSARSGQVTDPYDGMGGGVLNLGTLTISGCIVSGNTARWAGSFGTGGGGIANFGTLAVSNCSLSNNLTFSGGGYADGGGIYNGGTLTMSGCTLAGNTADNGGGIYNDFGGTATVSNCGISNNSCYAQGGGIYNAWNLTVSTSTFSGNKDALSGSPDTIHGPYTDGGGNIFN